VKKKGEVDWGERRGLTLKSLLSLPQKRSIILRSTSAELKRYVLVVVYIKYLRFTSYFHSNFLL